MNSVEKRTQILSFAEAFGIKRPKQMPKDFVAMQYATGAEGLADYAYLSAKAIFTAAIANGNKLDSHAKSDAKTVLTVWSTLVYANAEEYSEQNLRTLQAIYEEYQGEWKEKVKMNLSAEVSKYLKKTAEGIRAMAADESFAVGVQDKEYYERAERLLLEAQGFVAAAIDLESPSANEIAKRILYGAGEGGVAAFRKGVSERMAPSLKLLETAVFEARRWSLQTAGGGKIKKGDLLSVSEDDPFALYAAMPNLGAKLNQFCAAVDANRSKLQVKLDKKRSEHASVEKEMATMEQKCYEFRARQLNGEMSPVDALAKVKELKAKIQLKRDFLDSDLVENVLESAIESNSELYRAVDYVRQLWDISEAILTTEERHELFSGFPYSEILNVLQGGTEHEETVRTEIYVARDGIDRKIEARRTTNARFAELWSQKNRTAAKEKTSGKTQGLHVDRNKAATDEMNAMFGGAEKVEEQKVAETEKPKLDTLLV